MKKGIIYPITLITDNLIVLVDILVFYHIWKAIYNGQNIFSGIGYSQIITYIILARIIYHLLAWGINAEISKIIKNGDITIELVRPIRFWSSKVLL